MREARSLTRQKTNTKKTCSSKRVRKKLKKINKQVQKDYEREKMDDFLDKAEHIQKVDKFMQNDLKLEEDKKTHLKVVEQYRDSLYHN